MSTAAEASNRVKDPEDKPVQKRDKNNAANCRGIPADLPEVDNLK